MKIVVKMRIFKPLKEEFKKRKSQFQRNCGGLIPKRFTEYRPKVLQKRFYVEDFGGNRKWNIFRLRLRESIRTKRRRKHEEEKMKKMQAAQGEVGGMNVLM